MFQEHLEKLISTGFKLIALETDSPEQSTQDFRPLVREGKAIYRWDSQSALSRMEASHITIPNTETPEMIINHIKQNKVYGIYLLVGFGNALKSKSLQALLKQFVSDKNNQRIIIFIDNQFNYPQNLMSEILITQEPDISSRSLLNLSN